MEGEKALFERYDLCDDNVNAIKQHAVVRTSSRSDAAKIPPKQFQRTTTILSLAF